MAILPRYAFVLISCTLFAAMASSGQASPPLPGGLFEADHFQAQARLATLDKKIAADPSNATLLLERATLHRQLGEAEGMRADLEKAVAVQPQSAGTWIAAGQVIETSDPSAAIPYYDRAITLSPGNIDALRLRAIAKANSNSPEAALADVATALTIAPRDALTLGLKGSILMHLGKLDDAIQAFSESLSSKPLPQVHFDRGACYYNLGNLPRAIEDYTAAYRLDDSLGGVLFERGLAYHASGDYRRAVDDLEQARKKTPDDPRAALLLSWIYATAPDDAVRNGRKALMVAGNLCDPVTCQTVEPLNALAAAYAELDEFDKAIKLQERAVALSYFAPEFREDGTRRLNALRRRQRIREPRTPLLVLPRALEQVPRSVEIEEALAAPAELLGSSYLQIQTLLQGCVLARAGATYNADLDGLPVSITPDNVRQIEPRLEERKRVCLEAIRQRGFVQLAEGYQPSAAGGCEEWGLGEAPWLVEQDGGDVYFTQGDVRHLGVVVESAIVFRHDMNTGVIITGEIQDGSIVFVTSQRYGITGTAQDRCTLTLTPARIEGDAWANAFLGRAFALRSYGQYASALVDLERAIETAPSPQLLAMHAYALAAWPDVKVRDGKRAVALAARAIELARGKPDESVLAAAAVAAAEAGDFTSAIAYQQRAMALAPAENRPVFEARLRLFESRRPYHEDPSFWRPSD